MDRISILEITTRKIPSFFFFSCSLLNYRNDYGTWWSNQIITHVPEWSRIFNLDKKKKTHTKTLIFCYFWNEIQNTASDVWSFSLLFVSSCRTGQEAGERYHLIIQRGILFHCPAAKLSRFQNVEFDALNFEGFDFLLLLFLLLFLNTL